MKRIPMRRWGQPDDFRGAFETEAFQTKVMKRIPMRRWGQPDDFRAIAVYFASDASAYHTGDTIAIDGGVSHF